MKLPPWLAPNRVAVYIGGAGAVLVAVASLLASIGTPEAVGLSASVLAFAALLDRFLKGWQKWEERLPVQALLPPRVLQQEHKALAAERLAPADGGQELTAELPPMPPPALAEEELLAAVLTREEAEALDDEGLPPPNTDEHELAWVASAAPEGAFESPLPRETDVEELPAEELGRP